MSYAGFISADITVPSGITLSATSNAGGPTSVSVTAGTYNITTLCAHLQTRLDAVRPVTAGNWTVSISTGSGGTGKVTIAVTAGTYSITWTSSTLRTILGFSGNISSQSTSTGSAQARGLWIPDCPIMMDSYHLSTPYATDLRQTESPTGLVISHIGNVKYRHKNVRWTHVVYNKIWAQAESVDNESLEQFLIDAVWGLGHSWFSPGSKCSVVAHDGNEVGAGSVDGWYLKGCAEMESIVRRAGEAWDGLWSVTIPEMVTNS